MKRGLPNQSDAADAVSRPVIIGRREYLSFVEWPALGVASYELTKTEVPRVRLRLALSRKHPERAIEVEAPVVRMTVVRNSGGTLEQRPVIEAVVRLGNVEKKIQLTLTRRSGMRCRMLIGRQALAGDFVVDVARKYVLPS